MPIIPSYQQHLATIMNPIVYVRPQRYNLPILQEINAQPLPIEPSSNPILTMPNSHSNEWPSVSENTIRAAQIARQQRQISFQRMVQEQQRTTIAEQQRVMAAQAQIAEQMRRMTIRLRQEIQVAQYQARTRESVATSTSGEYVDYLANEQTNYYGLNTQFTGRTWSLYPETEEPEDGEIQETQGLPQTSTRTFNAATSQNSDDLEVIDITSQASDTEPSSDTTTDDEVVYRGRLTPINTTMSPTTRESEQRPLVHHQRPSFQPLRTISIQEPPTHRIKKGRKRSFKIFDEYDPTNYAHVGLKSRKKQHIQGVLEEMPDN